MSRLKLFKRVISLAVSLAVSSALLTAYRDTSDRSNNASAKTIEELQNERAENQAKIDEYETQLSELARNKDSQQQYQQVLTEQIQLIQDNIKSLNDELERIQSDIDATEANILKLNNDIAALQTKIDDNIEEFKERLKEIYISGNGGLAAVVLGSSDFYEMISRLEMVNRIASHDQELIDGILADIDTMEQSKKDIETEKLTLEMKQEEQERRKDEKAEELDSYNEKMKLTQSELDRIAMEEKRLKASKEDLEAANEELAAEEQNIVDEINRQKEEAQRRYEEEQRRKQEQQQQQQQTDNTVTQPPSYVPPAPQATGFMWPAPGFAYISSYFGPRNMGSGYHYGIDIGDAGIHGGAAVASKSGTVIQVNNSCQHNYAKDYSCGCGGGYGNYVVIAHDGTYSTLYGHLTSATVSVGDYVEQGQVIGLIGCTGYSTGSHLHFEVYVNGVKTDPLRFVSP